ncbi:acyltransferase [Sphingomonas sp. TREG-RG-20F-R18-01]|uniref:acyltransferase n=1 Tax=Sphingomonas sp. TREG-RG-20F-R18-01 TaxID=2914982 RepID=UPI0024122406|nr:acyltransferase [Sphingomonas sp. TREG-RG-20F-R18-01]
MLGSFGKGTWRAASHSPERIPRPSNGPSTQRDGGIELFRYVMALLVIGIHVLPPVAVNSAQPLGLPDWAVAMDVLCRCAVPFFFIASGYYFKPERGVVANLTRAIARIAPIYGAWYCLYLAVAAALPEKLPSHWRILALIDGGPAFHLWFLPALLLGLIILTISLAAGGRVLAILVAMVLAAAGPALADYHALIGMDTYPAHLNDFKRQLGAPAFVVIGYLLKGTKVQRPSFAFVLCGLSLVAMFAERYSVTLVLGNRDVGNAESLLAVFPFGASVFNLARSLNGDGPLDRLSGLGRISLAVYLIHPLFIWMIRTHLDAGFGYYLYIAGIVAAGSTATAFVVVRVPWLRRLIT